MPIPSNQINTALIFIAALLINELIQYFHHRVDHKIPFLWDLHEFHHSATEMTILNKERNSPYSNILTGIFTLPFSLFTGLLVAKYLSEGFPIPFYLYLFDTIVHISSGYLGHSSLKVIYPKFISYFLMSPSLHWLHHSDNPAHHDCNFGSKYTLWDKIFGTYLDESHLKDITSYGIEGTQYNKYHPLYSFSILPLLKLGRRLRRVFAW